MAKASMLGLYYVAPKYHLIEVSSRDVPARAKVGDRVRVPQRPISNRELTNEQIRKLVEGRYVVQAPSGMETILVVELLKEG